MKIPKIRIPKPRNLGNLVIFADKIVTLIGISFIFAGIYQIYPPAAWITLGVILAWPGMPERR